VAKLADAQDLKSWDRKRSCGFDPRPRHQIARAFDDFRRTRSWLRAEQRADFNRSLTLAMNELSKYLQTGTVGELLVQLRLLQFDVQSVAPHKDTGNDLLATRGEVFRALQVKATSRGKDRENREITFRLPVLMARRFHILALVFLKGEDRRLDLDKCDVYLLARDEVKKGCYRQDELEPCRLTSDRIDVLFR
jgi:hypothetical protein